MTSKAKRNDPLPRGRRRRPPRLIAAGFIAAFVASIATVIYTGLLVNAPRQDDGAEAVVQESGAGVDRVTATNILAEGSQGDGEAGEAAAERIGHDDEAEHDDDEAGRGREAGDDDEAGRDHEAGDGDAGGDRR